MAKLDELAELLTEEIKGFQDSVDRMEELKKFLMDYKVEADTSGIDFILKRYNDHQKKAVEEQHKQMADAVRHIKKSMTFPNWAIKLFSGLLAIIFLVMGYSIYRISRIPEIKRESYGQGEEEVIGHFRAFFRASPEAGELYREWREDRNKK